MAKQEFAKEADINTIMSRYARTGQLPQGERVAQYGDFTGVDYRAMQDLVARGRQEFEALPADLRRQFGNDPATYFAEVSQATPERLRELGLDALAAERSPAPVDPVPVAPAPATEPAKEGAA